MWSEAQKYKNGDDADTKTIQSDIRIHLKWSESGRGKNCDWFTWQSVVSRPLLYQTFLLSLFAHIFPPLSLSTPRFCFQLQITELSQNAEHYLLCSGKRKPSHVKPNNPWPQHIFRTATGPQPKNFLFQKNCERKSSVPPTPKKKINEW